MNNLLGLMLVIIIGGGNFGCRHPEPETYFIPKGMIGRVNIIFDQLKGESPKYENGRRVYRVPANGILLTKFKAEDGYINHQYFFTNQNGSKKLLKIFQYEHNKDGTIKWIISDSSEVGIFLDGTTGVYGNGNIKFQEFIVSNFSTLDSFYKTKYRDDFNKEVQRVLMTPFTPDTLSAQKMKESEHQLK